MLGALARHPAFVLDAPTVRATRFIRGASDLPTMPGILERLRLRRAPPAEASEKRTVALQGRQRHLQNKLNHNQREVRKLWTDYRNLDDSGEKKALKREINRVEHTRKKLLKQMSTLTGELKRLDRRR